MKTIEYRDVVDKTGWGNGPWLDEPDKIQFEDDATKLPCLIVRTSSGGHFCGYVGVPNGHPWHGVDCERIPAAAHRAAHGDLNFSDTCAEGDAECNSVCHIPGDDEPDDVWWLGFDCAHGWDYTPASNVLGNSVSSYRDVPYVKARIAELAAAVEASR